MAAAISAADSAASSHDARAPLTRLPSHPSTPELPSVTAPLVLPSRLLLSLEDADARCPTQRKLLVCRDHGEGRELLRALALRKGGWIGWEAATLRNLADEMALSELADRGLRTLDEIEFRVAVDEALDAVLEHRGDSAVFRPLAEGAGFRKALADAIDALRLSGVEVVRLRHAPDPDGKLGELAEVLEAYLAQLEKRRAADSAAVFEQALASFDAEIGLLAARLFVGPGLGTRGLSGRLLRKVMEAGADWLEADPVYGLEAPSGLFTPRRGSAVSPDRAADLLRRPRRRSARTPAAASGEQFDLLEAQPADPPGPTPASDAPQATGDDGERAPTCLAWLHSPGSIPERVTPLAVDFFRASSPASEVREVLRRVLQLGVPWDNVEIVATDPVAYGCALDALAASVGVEVTYAVGLPIERSRVGRVLHTLLTWLESGLNARPLWEALASGNLRAPPVDGAPPVRARVVRELRGLRIGWGAARYASALATLRERLRNAGEGRVASDERAKDTTKAERRALESLTGFLAAALRAVPSGVRESPPEEAWSSAAEVAAGGLVFLELFRPQSASEQEALRRLTEVLERVKAVSHRRTRLGAALAEVRAHSTIRVPSPHTTGRQPWSASAGRLHLTDVTHGGRSGRPITFLVGLDAERTAPGRTQDPVLLNADRRTLAGADLPTSTDRLQEGQYTLAALLAGLRGKITLSYASWEASDGSTLSPSPVLLQALRAARRDPRIGFERAPDGRSVDGLMEILGEPVSFVPAGDAAMDATDVWLGTLAEGSILLDGRQIVREGFPMLARGLAAREALSGSAPTAYHGLVPGAGELDPRDRAEGAISPSALQTLAACPLAWFYENALKVTPPDDPEYDPGRWLDDSQRGELLHTIFERFGREFRGRQAELDAPAATEALERIVGDEIDRFRDRVPAPSAAAQLAESDEVLRSARVFLEMERSLRTGEWLDFELKFGYGGAEPAELVLPDGRGVRIRGRIDRVDRLPDGSLLVVDYKTGRARYYERVPGEPPFAGGRQIQAGVYSAVVERLLRIPVERFEYRFPTVRGEHGVVPYEGAEIDGASAVVETLLTLVERGLFLPTDEPQDCSWCDYKAACRVVKTDRHIQSPPAEWASRWGPTLEEYALLRELRGTR